MPKKKPRPPQTVTPPSDDPTLVTLKDIVASEGLPPKPGLLSKLMLFWAKSTADAQARGTRIASQVRKEQADE